MQLSKTQRERIHQAIEEKYAAQHSSRSDEVVKEVEGLIVDFLEAQSSNSNKQALEDRIQRELKNELKGNTEWLSKEISKVVFAEEDSRNSRKNNDDDDDDDDEKEQDLYRKNFYSDTGSDLSDDDDEDHRGRSRRSNRKHSKKSMQSKNDDDDDDDDNEDGEDRNRSEKRRSDGDRSDSEQNQSRNNRNQYNNNNNNNKNRRESNDDQSQNRRQSSTSTAAHTFPQKFQNSSSFNGHNNNSYNSSGNGQNQNYNSNKRRNNEFNNNTSNNNGNNNYGNQRQNQGQQAAPLPSFATKMIGNPVSALAFTSMMQQANNPTLMQMQQMQAFQFANLTPFPAMFPGRLPGVQPPVPTAVPGITYKPALPKANTNSNNNTNTSAVPTAVVSTQSQSKNQVFIFHIPAKLNNIQKISSHFSHRFGAVSSYDKIDDFTASVKFESEDSAKKAIESKEKPFKIDQIVVQANRTPVPPRQQRQMQIDGENGQQKGNNNNINNNNNNNTGYTYANSTNHYQQRNNNNNNANSSNNEGNEPGLVKKQKVETTTTTGGATSTTNNNVTHGSSSSSYSSQSSQQRVQLNIEAKKKQKILDDAKRVLQLKFAEKLKVMIFIKQREQGEDNTLRQEAQAGIDAVKSVKDLLQKAQSQEDLNKIQGIELFSSNQFDYSLKVSFSSAQDVALQDLRGKLTEFGKIETLKPRLMEKIVDVSFSDFASAEKAYFGLRGEYTIEFANRQIVPFLRNPFQEDEEEDEMEQFVEDQGQEQEEQQQQEVEEEEQGENNNIEQTNYEDNNNNNDDNEEEEVQEEEELEDLDPSQQQQQPIIQSEAEIAALEQVWTEGQAQEEAWEEEQEQKEEELLQAQEREGVDHEDEQEQEEEA